LLASAIAQSEGYFAPQDDRPKHNNNPGDLRASPLPRKKDSGGFVVFYTPAEGWMSLLVQLMLYAQRGYNLRQTVYSWAPPSGPDGGNNSALYLSETLRRMNKGLVAPLYTEETKLSDLFHFESIP